MNNIRKHIYDKYNDSSEKLLDILSEMLRNKSVEVEVMSELLKSDLTLLNIYKTECEHLRLLKNSEKICKGLDILF